jgi:DNA-directed RNA polymerase subunit N (RpoN/RPB10)
MLIPVRCFTCGKVIADKWTTYEKDLQAVLDGTRQQTVARSGHVNAPPSQSRLTCARDVLALAPAGQVLDKLGITKICCRRHFLTNVDLLDSM